MSLDFINEVDTLLADSRNYIVKIETESENQEKIRKQLEEIDKELKEKSKTLEDMIRAATLLGNVADENTQFILGKITGVINSALAEMFKEDKRKISIKQVMYRNVYPHFVVELETADGRKRTFKKSGTGLAQVVSFLFTVCLIDARKGRKIVVMDELLNGLHPDAKIIIKNLIKVLSDKFQFVIVEYGVDIGKQYEVVKTSSVADVIPYQGEAYYKDLNLRNKCNEDSAVKNMVSGKFVSDGICYLLGI